MNINPSDDYEEMAAAFQCAQIQILDAVLKENGIKDDLRRKINEEYTFNYGVLLDQQWIESNAGRVFPIVTFSNKHWEQDPSDLVYNNGFFSWHEYALGDISWFYDENWGKDKPQKIGNVG